jgi:hypothetical protein
MIAAPNIDASAAPSIDVGSSAVVEVVSYSVSSSSLDELASRSSATHLSLMETMHATIARPILIPS